MKKILILTALGLALAGCQTAESPRPVLSEIAAPQPQPITTRPVAWKVYTAKDIQKLAADMKAAGADVDYRVYMAGHYTTVERSRADVDAFVTRSFE